MLTTPKAKGGLFLASSLCDGLEDNDIKQVTTLLLNKEADPNILIPTHGVTPFHLVIGNDSEVFAEEVTKLFLRHGGNPNVRSTDGLTPVHVAAAWGRVTVLELLLANGGDPLCVDEEGRNPFHYAFDGKYYKAITILSKYCESNANDEKNIKYTMAFDKLLINNGSIVAEYVAPQNTEDTLSTDKEFVACSNVDEFSFRTTSTDSVNCRSPFPSKAFGRSGNLDAAELQVREVLEKEKCLINEIINQLSTSLTARSKSDEGKCSSSASENQASNENSEHSLNASFQLSTDENVDHVFCNSKSHSVNKTRRHYVAPRFRRRNNSTVLPPAGSPAPRSARRARNVERTPLTPRFNLNNSIISMSPNFMTAFDVNEKGYFTPKITSETAKEFKARTPCARQKSYQLDEFHLGNAVAKSTPRRRRKVYRDCRSLRTLRKNHKLNSLASLDTSRGSSTSLSPDLQDRSPTFEWKINKRLEMEPYESFNLRIERCNESDADYENKQINFPSKNKNGMCKVDGKLSGKESSVTQTEDSSFETCENSLNEAKNCLKTDREGVLCRDRLFNDRKMDECAVKEESELTKSDIFNLDNGRATSSSSLSYISVQEEYKYEDKDNGIAFLERRLYSLPTCKIVKDEDSSESVQSMSRPTHLPREFSNEALRRRLQELGDNPGPITSSTQRLYLNRLVHLENNHSNGQKTLRRLQEELPAYRPDSLAYGDWVNKLDTFRILEKEIFREFASPDPSRRWREGTNKTSFNYLLLDPRVTKDLSQRAATLSKSELWSVFLSAIFYVGKGKGNRPYSHLYDAFNAFVLRARAPPSKKIERILSIWNTGHGVVCLHVFHNTIPVEAYTREAAMIDALGTELLDNCKSGDYYGIAATWNAKQKRQFGRYLLYKALQILIHEGERQLFPENL